MSEQNIILITYKFTNSNNQTYETYQDTLKNVTVNVHICREKWLAVW